MFFSPWVDKYEEVIENRYSQDILNSFLAKKINGVYVSVKDNVCTVLTVKHVFNKVLGKDNFTSL